VIVAEEDCGTLDGIEMEALAEGGEIIQNLGERLLGRVTLDDIRDPYSGNVLVPVNTMITEAHIKLIDDAGIEKVVARSALSCRSKHGICAKCYGKDLARGRMVNIGEAVGIIAAQSIGEPGTQLTMRTFHVGGTAMVVEQSSIKFSHPGIARYKDLKASLGREGELVAMNRNGMVALEDENGRERETYAIVYGAKVKVKDGQKVEAGTLLAEWDPYTIPILTDVPGKAKFMDLVEEITVMEHIDEVTGLSRSVIIEPKDPELRPRILITDNSGKILKIPGTKNQARYNLPVGAHMFIKEGSEVFAGDVLVKIPRETTKTKDITGGLPRVVELFEARRPKECAVVTEIDGEVSYGKDTKGKRKVTVTPELGAPKDYMIPKSKHISVHEGDFVRAGEPLMDGAVDPHDILRIRGEKDLAKYLVNEVQEVYRLQGVRINDKHIEVIVRQMLKRVKIKDPGDTETIEGEYLDKFLFEAENQRVVGQGQTPAIAEPFLLGITKASLNTESFLSAASFQETTRVLTEASVQGKVDHLVGLKENVLMGRLVPAGTGFPVYRKVDIELGDEDIFEDDLVEKVLDR
jgi:DNA-directed RNA polymerase subunit beta'